MSALIEQKALPGPEKSKAITCHLPDGFFKLSSIRNPFKPMERDLSDLPVDDRCLADFAGALWPGQTYKASVNGKLLSDEEALSYKPTTGDYILICPVLHGGGGGGGGKNPLALIATLAITIVSFGVGGLVAGTGWGAFGATAGWGAASYLAAGAVMYLGGQLISGMGPKPSVDIPNTEASAFENGYSWGNRQPLTNQGNPVALTYGTVRVTGQLLGQHVDSDGEKQYLNLLLCGGEGPLDSISSVKVNSNPVENFSGTSEKMEDTTLAFGLSTSYQTVRTTSTKVKGVDVEISFPSGIYGSGGYGIGTANIRGEYRKVGDSTWTVFFEKLVSGRKLYPFKETFNKTGLLLGQYDIRLAKTSASGLVTTAMWMRLTEISVTGDVEVVTRLGTNDQTVIPFFSDSYADQALNVELNPDAFDTYQTEGDAGSGIEITFTFPQGLAYINDDGSAGETWIKLDVDYKLEAAANWTSWLSAQEIKAAENKPIRRTFSKSGLTPGRYQVRCKINSRAGSTNRFANICVWSQLTHVVYDDFIRPNKSLVAVKAMATDKLSGGMPSISWLQTRSTVLVYNPGTAAYEAKSAKNPAWICYDLIHRAKSLKNIQTGLNEIVVFGASYTKIDYTLFSQWADFCDELVNGLKRCEVNFYIDAAAQLWDALQKVAQSGRGMVILRGTQLSCVWDGVSQPVMMFTVGNIVKGSLQGEYLTGKDRADAVEVSFLNEDKDFDRDTIVVYGDDFDSTEAVTNPTQVFFYGITDYRRAYREGLYRLRLNKYLKRAISFQADVDALACQVGDVILVQHDVPRWGQGGRLEAATANTVTLDKEVTLEPSVVYEVKVRLKDDSRVTKYVVAVSETTVTKTLTLTESFETVPEQFDMYAFGRENISTKPFKTTKISRAGDLRVRIDATEYYPEIYDETATVPDIDYSEALPTVRDLILGFHFDLSGKGYLDISWQPPRGSYGGASILVNGLAVAKVESTITEYAHEVTADRAYIVTVIGLDAIGRELAPITASYTVTALSIPTFADAGQTAPTISEDTYILTDGTVLTDIPVILTLPDYRFFSHVNIYYRLDGTGAWTKAGETSTGAFTVKALKSVKGHTIQIDARIVNRWGVEGGPGLSASLALVGKSAPPSNVTGLTASQNPLNKPEVLLTWDVVTDPDFDRYEVRRGGTGWADATIVPVTSNPVSQPRATWTASASGSQTFRVKAVDRSGNYSAAEINTTLTVTVEPIPVTGLAGTQDPQNKAVINLTWTPSTEKDVVGYEVRVGGSSWATATVVGDKVANAYTSHTLSASGSYTFRIKAINRAGFYSAEATKVVTATVEPIPVTGLAGTQDPQNKAVINLTWTPSTEKDIASYEVRVGGSSWATATVVGDKLADPYTTYQAASTGSYTFRIKAINRAGFYSAEATTTITATVEPVAISGLTATQNSQNRAQLLITWTPSAEKDIKRYELRIGGSSWETAAVIGDKLADPKADYTISATGFYRLRIKGINRAGFYSAEATADISATVEPSNVTGLQALQNGNNVLLSWNEVADLDVIGYEIREGPSFNLGRLIATGVTDVSTQVPVDSERSYNFTVKAINVAGFRSVTAANAVITVSDLLPTNVIFSYDELSLQSGTHSGTQFRASNYRFSNFPGLFSSYPTTRFNEVGAGTVLALSGTNLTGTYTCARKDVGKVIQASLTAEFNCFTNFDGDSFGKLQFRTSTDGTNFTEWKDFKPVLATFRYLDFRIIITRGQVTDNPEVSYCIIKIDVPDFDTAGRDVTVAVGGTAVSFGHTYWAIPVVVATAVGVGVFAEIVPSSESVTGFTVKVKNFSGTDVGGKINWQARGY